MRLLLDTHALIWWWTNDPQLSAQARDALLDEGNEVFVSAASAWEIATKQRLGKLKELPDLRTARFQQLLAADGFGSLPITPAHALRAGAHPAAHRDPFDRMLAAQAELEGLQLVTTDRAFGQFEVAVLW